MTSYGYIIMIIVDSCMIWFHFDCIMQLNKSYYIATNVCSRKSATTFGDLPDWWVTDVFSSHKASNEKVFAYHDLSWATLAVALGSTMYMCTL